LKIDLLMSNQIRDKYTVVIGLEIHAQLLTGSKIYAPDTTKFGEPPNTQVSVITLAHPGTLPKLNKKVLEYAIKMGLACHSDITRKNIFCRKNYFYPDLPKGYQLTQDKTPICVGGYFTVKPEGGNERKIRLNRIHVEEDAGKSIHIENEDDTLVDLNRAGVPLIEIVTEPDLRSTDEAYSVLYQARKLVRYLDICDGNMEEGSLRCDANVSLMLKGADEYGKKVELKNMNSLRNVKNAIEHEIDRQIDILESGGTILSETRTYNPNTGLSQGMREKEDLNDYRYFPEPDLSPVIVDDAWLEEIRAGMPVLPEEYLEKFQNQYKLPEYDARVLSESREMASYFDDLCSKTKNYKAASNWLMGPVKSVLNEMNLVIDSFSIKPTVLAEVIAMIDDSRINFTIASQQLFPAMLKDPEKSPALLAAEMNLLMESDKNSIRDLIQEVLKEHPDEIKAFRSGKKALIGMFMGEIMKKSRGKADPKKANQLLRELLQK